MCPRHPGHVQNHSFFYCLLHLEKVATGRPLIGYRLLLQVRLPSSVTCDQFPISEGTLGWGPHKEMLAVSVNRSSLWFWRACSPYGRQGGKTPLLRCDKCVPPVLAQHTNIFITRLGGLIHLAADPAVVRNATFNGGGGARTGAKDALSLSSQWAGTWPC